MWRTERKRIQRKNNQTKRNNYQILHAGINEQKESGKTSRFPKNFFAASRRFYQTIKKPERNYGSWMTKQKKHKSIGHKMREQKPHSEIYQNSYYDQLQEQNNAWKH